MLINFTVLQELTAHYSKTIKKENELTPKREIEEVHWKGHVRKKVVD